MFKSFTFVPALVQIYIAFSVITCAYILWLQTLLNKWFDEDDVYDVVPSKAVIPPEDLSIMDVVCKTNVRVFSMVNITRLK